MKKLSGVILKEILILFRDLPALLFLFVMPALLLIIISITEDRVSNQNKIPMLLIAPDTSVLKQDISEGLQKSHFFKIKNIRADDSLAVENAKQDIAEGKYQAGIIIPADANQAMAKHAENLVTLSSTNPAAMKDSLNSKKQTACINIFFDPAIKESLKYSLINALNGIITGIEIKVMIKKYFSSLEGVIKKQLQARMDSLKQNDPSVGIPNSPIKDEINRQVCKTMGNLNINKMNLKIPEFPWQPQSLLTLNETYANDRQNLVIKPSVSQNRVPGFTLFAMFFIVLPLAGSIVTERNEGANNRLRTLPVSYLTLMVGKIILYSFVCLFQFFFMMSIGMYVLPRFFDMPALIMGTHYFAILITAIMSSLAAIGFGLLVGSWARTHAQASTFGSLMVVILGVLGGVFIPIYLIPESIKTITIISPMRWGIDAFIDLFVRNDGLYSVFPNIACLFSFFILSLTITLYSYSRKK